MNLTTSAMTQKPNSTNGDHSMPNDSREIQQWKSTSKTSTQQSPSKISSKPTTWQPSKISLKNANFSNRRKPSKGWKYPFRGRVLQNTALLPPRRNQSRRVHLRRKRLKLRGKRNKSLRMNFPRQTAETTKPHYLAPPSLVLDMMSV